MQDRQLLALIQAVHEANDLGSESALAARVAASADCIPMSRLDAIARAAPNDSRAVETAVADRIHIAHCGHCAARLRALRETQASATIQLLPTRAPMSTAARRSPWWIRWERFGVAVAAAAACVLLLVTPHKNHRLVTLGRTAPAHAAHATVCMPCDVNCDGVINVRDIDAFILAVIYPGEYSTTFPRCDIYCSADSNRNCRLDDEDLDNVVACVTPRRVDQ